MPVLTRWMAGLLTPAHRLRQCGIQAGSQVGRDLKLSSRLLLRRPAFLVGTVATMALATGLSSALFAVGYGVVIRPLPYPSAERLIRIYETNAAKGRLKEDVSVGAFHDWRESARTLEAIALFSKGSLLYTSDGSRRALRGMRVSPDFFRVLGVQPMIGAGFAADSSYNRSQPPDVVISYELWHSLFAGAAAAIEQTIAVDGRREPLRVVGIMPQGFFFDRETDLWTLEVVRPPISRGLRNLRYDRVVARMRPPVTPSHVQSELAAVSVRLAREFPSSNDGWTATVERLHSSVVGRFADATWILLTAVLVIVGVACLNVAALFASRTVARGHETSLHIALGASRGRMMRLWFTEASAVAGLGGAIGLALAYFTLRILKALAADTIPRLREIEIDGVIVALIFVTILACSLLITALSARWASSEARLSGLRTAESGMDRRRQRLRELIVAGQCAGAILLTVVAVVLLKSWQNVARVETGWSADGVLTMALRLAGRADGQQYLALTDRVSAHLEGLGQVEAAAITTQIPLTPNPISATLAMGPEPVPNELRWPAVQHHVSERYFDAMHLTLVEGRQFDHRENLRGDIPRDRGVAILSRQAASALWPAESAVGKLIRIPAVDNVPFREVVGVIEDFQFYLLGEQPAMHVFVPWSQSPTTYPKLILRLRDAAITPDAVSNAIRAAESNVIVHQVATLETIVDRATAMPRVVGITVATLALLLVLLVAVGLYSSLALSVSSRIPDISVRLALGARRRSIATMVLVWCLRSVVIGAIAGGTLAIVVMRASGAFLFGVEPADPLLLATGIAAFVGVAALSCVLPAYRAVHVDPASSFRRS
jgi:putative ABC transport system permease protein